MAGGDIGAAGWDSPAARPVREKWLAAGGTRDEFVEILRAVDPVADPPAAAEKRILMLNASDDEVIPRACTVSLWKAFGEPEIQWYSGGHISVMRHLFSACCASDGSLRRNEAWKGLLFLALAQSQSG